MLAFLLSYIACQVNETNYGDHETFATTVQSDDPGPMFSPTFALRYQAVSKSILDMPQSQLLEAWTTCIQNARKAKVAVEDEIKKATDAHVRSRRICWQLALTHCFW